MEILLIVCGMIAFALLAQFIRTWVYEGFSEAIRITLRKFIAVTAILAIGATVFYFAILKN